MISQEWCFKVPLQRNVIVSSRSIARRFGFRFKLLSLGSSGKWIVSPLLAEIRSVCLRRRSGDPSGCDYSQNELGQGDCGQE